MKHQFELLYAVLATVAVIGFFWTMYHCVFLAPILLFLSAMFAVFADTERKIEYGDESWSWFNRFKRNK